MRYTTNEFGSIVPATPELEAANKQVASQKASADYVQNEWGSFVPREQMRPMPEPASPQGQYTQNEWGSIVPATGVSHYRDPEAQVREQRMSQSMVAMSPAQQQEFKNQGQRVAAGVRQNFVAKTLRQVFSVVPGLNKPVPEEMKHPFHKLGFLKR
jgi:hypothetical protein